jgi:hypothetical protein
MSNQYKHLLEVIMKKVMKQCMIIAVVMACMFIPGFFGCDLIPGKGNLDLTIQSDIDPNDIAFYDITLTGPGNTVETEQSEVNTVLFTDLSSGPWNINVKIVSEDDTVLDEVNDSAIIEKDKTVEKIITLNGTPTPPPTDPPPTDPPPTNPPPTDPPPTNPPPTNPPPTNPPPTNPPPTNPPPTNPPPTPTPKTGGTEVFIPGGQDTFTIPSYITSVTYSKVTVIGGGGGGDGGYAYGTSSGSWAHYGGGGGAGNVVIKENIIEIRITYGGTVGRGGRGGQWNGSGFENPGCGNDNGVDGEDSILFGGSTIIIAAGGNGAECQNGGSGYPSGTSGSQCFSSANPPGAHCDREPPEGTGGDNGSGYGKGGDGACSSAGEDGQHGAIIIEWRGVIQ